MVTAGDEEPVPERICCPSPSRGGAATLGVRWAQTLAGGGRGHQHGSSLGACRRPVPGEKMAGVRPATASWRFLAKPGIFQMSTPSKVAASMSRTFCSRSASARSFRPMLLSSCCTWGAGPVRTRPAVAGWRLLTDSGVHFPTSSVVLLKPPRAHRPRGLSLSRSALSPWGPAQPEGLVPGCV